MVTLSQTPSSDSDFKGWTGCQSEPAGKCKVTMSAAKVVKAKFDLKPKFKLTVEKSGTGTGTVTSSPAGIDCGGDCEEEYPEGDSGHVEPGAVLRLQIRRMDRGLHRDRRLQSDDERGEGRERGVRHHSEPPAPEGEQPPTEGTNAPVR